MVPRVAELRRLLGCANERTTAMGIRPPAGLDAAIKKVNAYGAATCGFTFES